MQRDGEASVDEILASIKKVIARDSRTEALETRRRRETDGVSERPEPVDPDEAEEVLELDTAEMIDDSHDDSPDDSHEYGSDGPQDDPLTGEATRRTMRETFDALDAIAQPGARPQIVRSGQTSLEDLTRDLLRPVLAEWLDRNLPPMVERLVKDEIARIARRQP